MKEKIEKMPGRIRNYFCSHMSAQVTVTVVLLLILAGLVLQIYVKKINILIICSGIPDQWKNP